MKPLTALLLPLMVMSLLAGCTTHDGHLEQTARSRTVIGGPDARIVSQLQVSRTCRYLFGIAIDDADLYQHATTALREEAQLDGPMALANLLGERTLEGLWPLYFTRRLTLSAQVVRFSPRRSDK